MKVKTGSVDTIIFDDVDAKAVSRKSESAGYAKGLFQLMIDLTKKTDDTVWLMNNETVFIRLLV